MRMAKLKNFEGFKEQIEANKNGGDLINQCWMLSLENKDHTTFDYSSRRSLIGRGKEMIKKEKKVSIMGETIPTKEPEGLG